MISFWVHSDGSFGIRNYCETRGLPIASRFESRLYEDVGPEVLLAGGTQLFSALDQLTPAERELVGALWDAHERAAPGALRLNDPRCVLLRRDLLKRLHGEGLNQYRVFDATDLSGLDRFPVFVRGANDHGGPRSGLLENHRDVVRAIRALRARGHRKRDLLVVEYRKSVGPDGLFRKYAAFKVGDAIVPCHVLVSRSWKLKARQHELREAYVAECLAYLDANPHEAWLRRVFAVAGVGYGRVDYGVVDGVPQVWEINLNPTVGRGRSQRPPLGGEPHLVQLREQERVIFHERLRAAFVGIDGPADGGPVRVCLDAGLLRRVRAERQRRERRRRLVAWLRRMYDHPHIGRPLRALGAGIAPRV